MQGLSVICDLAAAVLLVLAAVRGAKGQALYAIVPPLAWGLGFAALGAVLAAQPSFGNLLLVVLALGVGGTLGAAAAIGVSVARIPLVLAGFLVLYGLVALLLSFAATDTGAVLWHARMGPGEVERRGAAMIAAIAGSLVLGGGGVLFLQRLRSVRLSSLWLPHAQVALAAASALTAGVFMVTNVLPAFWLSAVAALLTGVFVVLPLDESARWPLSVLLTALCGFATAAIGFALASLLLIIAGGLVGASMVAVFSGLCREGGRRPFRLLFGKRR